MVHEPVSGEAERLTSRYYVGEHQRLSTRQVYDESNLEKSTHLDARTCDSERAHTNPYWYSVGLMHPFGL